MKKKDKEPMPEIDESLLTPEQKEELHKKVSYKGWIIFFAIIVALIVTCFIVIFSLGGPVK